MSDPDDLRSDAQWDKYYDYLESRREAGFDADGNEIEEVEVEDHLDLTLDDDLEMEDLSNDYHWPWWGPDE